MSERAGIPLDVLIDRAGLTTPAWDGAWPVVRGVCHDSRRARSGDLFIAIVGERFDGRRFAADAVAGGAVAVLGPASQGGEPAVPWIELDRPRRRLGELARAVYGAVDEQLLIAGVTGTNGKGTVMTLLAAILDAAGRPAGKLGTLGCQLGERHWDTGGRTTPEASDVHRVLAEMKGAGAAAAVMEVSSHALEIGRVDGLAYDLAIFTNLSRDHLDFHGDMESYFTAKRRLFDRLKAGGRAVVQLGDGRDPWGRRLAAELGRTWRHGQHRLLTCGGDDGEVRIVSADTDLDGIRATLRTPDGELRVSSPLLGRFHLENLLTAATAALALDLPPSAIERGLGHVGTVPGRLERVPGDVPVLVDYAHTPAALEAALEAVRDLSPRPIIAVFGCGGERDRGKRPEMGRVAGRLADLPVLTSDNPRREDPAQILADAEAGLRQSGCVGYLVEPDRRTAIRQAVARARAGDFLVLVTGKGHEATQDLGDVVVPFDDRLELAAALESTTAGTAAEEICCG